MGLPADTRVWIAAGVTDMRRGFDGLAAIVQSNFRKSRYVLAGHIWSKHAEGVTAVATRLLKPYRDQCHTITFDNGKEFADHETLAVALGANIYFAHPYRPWERGLNENSNGLLRQYFAKGMALTDISQEQVQYAVDRLNHRPRKVLDFKTPF